MPWLTQTMVLLLWGIQTSSQDNHGIDFLSVEFSIDHKHQINALEQIGVKRTTNDIYNIAVYGNIEW